MCVYTMHHECINKINKRTHTHIHRKMLHLDSPRTADIYEAKNERKGARERVRQKSVEMKILVEKVDSFYIRGHLEATVVVVDQLD